MSLGIHVSVCFTVGVCSVVGLVFFVYSVLFITIPFYLKLTCITEWLERLREAVDISPANPAERYLPSLLCLQHFQDFGGLSFKTSCSDKKSMLPMSGA